jgi:DNA-binding protein H-NS
MNNKDLDGLLAERAKLDKLIEEKSKEMRQPALDDVKAKIDLFKFTAEELGFGNPMNRLPTPKSKGERAKVDAKYKDDQGNTWSGRGRAPDWLKTDGAVDEKLKEKYAIK